MASLGYGSASYLYPEFRDDVGQALRSYFQSGSVTEGDKAFDVSGNTYRVEADVAPFFEYRLFLQTGGFLSGVAMRPASGGKLVNWPDQHYENAVAKNQATQRAFKGCVRILKTARNRMIAEGYQSAAQVPSFLVECMTYNAPNTAFNHGTWTEDVRACLVSMFNQTGTQGDAAAMTEVSGLKALFGTHQKWDRERANAFIVDCWNYLGFE